MKGPEKVSWLRYYIIQPVEDFFNIIGDTLATTWIKLKGGWYCDYCGKMHCRRVYKYKLLFYNDGHVETANIAGTLRDISDESGKFVCSLGRDAVLNEGWKPSSITIGDKLQSGLELAVRAFRGVN